MSYTLYYWPIPFRGHPVRFILAHAGAKWDEADFEAIGKLKGMSPENQPYPFMAPPLLHDHDNDAYISQLPAIVMALGRKLGLTRDPDLELRLICDASDILLEITRSHGLRMWDRESWTEFRSRRLPRWMQIHERLVRDHDLTSNNVGVAQLVLAALWHTMIDRLPQLRPILAEHAPRMEALVDEIADTPAIAALRANWEGSSMKYCAGQIEASLLEMLEKDANA